VLVADPLSPVKAALALAPGPVSFLVTPLVTSVTWTVVPAVVTLVETFGSPFGPPRAGRTGRPGLSCRSCGPCWALRPALVPLDRGGVVRAGGADVLEHQGVRAPPLALVAQQP
jgi:hypothetical protein